jgi:hypothetical protein
MADVTARIIAFLREIGLTVELREIDEKTILPGISIEGGALLVDEAKLLYSGDLLHESGHLAVVSPEQRGRAGADVEQTGGEEMAAIGWSYAAALHLGLPPEAVFHADGYRGGSASLLENFAAGRYLAVPYLQWIGLDEKHAAETGVKPYPHMLRWLRD